MASLQGVASMGMMRHAAKMTPRAGLRASPPAAIRILCPSTKPLEAVREDVAAMRRRREGAVHARWLSAIIMAKGHSLKYAPSTPRRQKNAAY